MLRLTGEQFTTFMKAQELRFEVVVGGPWIRGNQAVFQNNKLQVAKAVFDCMVDQDTLLSTLLSLDIVMLKSFDITDFVPMEIPAVDIEKINYLFGIKYTPPDITKGLHGEDLPIQE